MLMYVPGRRDRGFGKTYAVGTRSSYLPGLSASSKLSRHAGRVLMNRVSMHWPSEFENQQIAEFLEKNAIYASREQEQRCVPSHDRSGRCSAFDRFVERMALGVRSGIDVYRCERSLFRFNWTDPEQPRIPKKRLPRGLPKLWVEFLILDHKGDPVPGIKGRVDTLEETILIGRTDNEGKIRFTDVPGWQCSFKYWTCEGRQTHCVDDGDCYLSLAGDYGVNPLAIWQTKQNKSLFVDRKNPNVLHPGDEVYIPEEVHDGGIVGTRQCHTYRIHSPACDLRVRVDLSEITDAPSVDYKITLETGAEHHGQVRNCGPNKPALFRIATSVKQGRLDIFLDPEDPDHTVSIDLGLGQLCPVDKSRGLQERLSNLGYEVGRIDGNPGPKTRHCVDQFRQEFHVEGDDDASLYRALERAHGA